MCCDYFPPNFSHKKPPKTSLPWPFPTISCVDLRQRPNSGEISHMLHIIIIINVSSFPENTSAELLFESSLRGKVIYITLKQWVNLWIFFLIIRWKRTTMARRPSDMSFISLFSLNQIRCLQELEEDQTESVDLMRSVCSTERELLCHRVALYLH